MNKITRNIVAGVAMAGIFGAVAPETAEAHPPKHVRKAIKKHHKYQKNHMKHMHKYHRMNARHHSPYGFYRPYSYKPPKRKQESFSIFSTPGGGLGFSYHESKGRYW